MAEITLFPSNRKVVASSGSNIFRVLSEHGIDTYGVCGGKGTCGKCRVKLIEGKIKGESLSDVNTFLACKTEFTEDISLEISPLKDASNRKSLLNQASIKLLKRSTNKFLLHLPKPSINDQCPDWERLSSQLPKGPEYKVTHEVLHSLSETLRDSQFGVTVTVRDNTVIAVERGDTVNLLYGISFDVGTTTVVGSLVNLNNGDILATCSVGNPQRVIGADVISRIEYCSANPEGTKTLQAQIISGMNQLVGQLTEETGVRRGCIFEATIVGNTTMQHLLLGLNPCNLARAPYVPTLKAAFELTAERLSLNLAGGAMVYILPNIAGFVGSDTVGVILSTGIHHQNKIQLALDIGTNGEVALGNKDRILVCSTAAGPAFEGAQITCGMRAADGAIEAVRITNEGVELNVIGTPPLVSGICGSGLIQAIAEMLRAGVLLNTGKMLDSDQASEKLPPCLARRLVIGNSGRSFELVPENPKTGQKSIFISQKDVRELQLAKAALAAGIQILLKELQISPTEIEEVLLAGAFGNYIDRESALTLGLIPQVQLEKVRSIGNAAGLGSRMALQSINFRNEAEDVASKAVNIELSSRPDFQEAFIDAMGFPF